MALLLVIWVMALLAALAASITIEVRTGMDTMRSMMDTSRSRALADSGVWGAIAMLLDERTYAGLRLDGEPQKLSTVGDGVTVALEDERGKLDLNNASEIPLRKLFQVTGFGERVAETLARNVVQYRGAKERATGQRGAAFASTEEVQLVAGFGAEHYERIARFVTVHSDDWRINPAIASPEVLLSLPDVDVALVQRYLALRRELADNPVALRLASPPAIASQAVWGEPRMVTIRSTARLESGAMFSRHAIVDLDPEGKQPFRIVEWALRRTP